MLYDDVQPVSERQQVWRWTRAAVESRTVIFVGACMECMHGAALRLDSLCAYASVCVRVCVCVCVCVRVCKYLHVSVCTHA